MSIESLNSKTATSETYSSDISKKNPSTRKVNIDVLKKRVFEEKKRERFQNRVLISMFCLSIAILGYIVV